MNVLCLNAGSSSLKFSVFDLDKKQDAFIYGEVENISQENSLFWYFDSSTGKRRDFHQNISSHKQAFQEIVKALHSYSIDAVSHRIVHGGKIFMGPALLDDEAIKKLKSLIAMAPLHLPLEIEVVEQSEAEFSKIPHIGCFDTAFHQSIPEVYKRFPLSQDLWEDGVHRYGFHGLSFEYIIDKLKPTKKDRIIAAHLGNGASICAIANRQSLHTSMGFTPVGGVMMGTRCGDLDPSVLLYLLREKKFSIDQVDKLINFQSGLLGVSGISKDMQILLEKKDRRAEIAIEMFCSSIAQKIGSYLTVLGGIDQLIFTGGIGEKSPIIREKICEKLSFLQLMLSHEKNTANEEIISDPKSSIQIFVINAKEDIMLAKHAQNFLKNAKN